MAGESARAKRIKAREQERKHGRVVKWQFGALPHTIKDSEAYHALSLAGRALLNELIRRYNGNNNGMIGLGVREAAYELRVGRTTVRRAMFELDDSGLARALNLGSRIGRRATEWQLAWRGCDKTRELPRHQWSQRKPYEPQEPKHKGDAPMTNAERQRRWRERQQSKTNEVVQ
jgi:hypothetical protein